MERLNARMAGGHAIRNTASPCCSSISIGSSTSTTASATARATDCSCPSPSGWRHGPARRRRQPRCRCSADVPAPEANTLARFGGDEFVVLLDDIREPIDAVRVAERIQRDRPPSRCRVTAQEVFATRQYRRGRQLGGAPHGRRAGARRRPGDVSGEGCRRRTATRCSTRRCTRRRSNGCSSKPSSVTPSSAASSACWYQPIVSLRDRQVVRLRGAGPLAASRTRPAGARGVPGRAGADRPDPDIDEWALAKPAARRGSGSRHARTAPRSTLSVNLSAKAFGLAGRSSAAWRTSWLRPACRRQP